MNGNTAVLKGPLEAVGKTVELPMFPRNSVFSPIGEDQINIYEMRFRQLFNDIGENGYFGHIYYNSEMQKFALVGTLAKVKKIDRLPDGGLRATIQGAGRFFLKDVKSDKPYLTCKVTLFYDYFENENKLRQLEMKLFQELRYSIKLLRAINPGQNYVLSEDVIKYRPAIDIQGVRSVIAGNSTSECKRRTKLSFAIMDMLKADTVTKLLFIQEHVVEKRFQELIKVFMKIMLSV